MEAAMIYENTELALMSTLPILCVCKKKLDWCTNKSHIEIPLNWYWPHRNPNVNIANFVNFEIVYCLSQKPLFFDLLFIMVMVTQ